MASTVSSIIESRYRKMLVDESWVLSGQSIADIAFDSSGNLYSCGKDGLSSYDGSYWSNKNIGMSAYAMYGYGNDIYYAGVQKDGVKDRILVGKVEDTSNTYFFNLSAP